NQGLELTNTGFGNVQLMDWRSGYLEIKAQHGFREEFMNFFKRVKLEDGSACARALRTRDSVVIEDIVVDQQFAPCLEIARRAGIRSVQSTPLISSSGALVGILSTHFPMQHQPTDIQMRAIKEAARLAANAIIHLRVGAGSNAVLDARLLASRDLLIESRRAIAFAETLLATGGRPGAIARSPWSDTR